MTMGLEMFTNTSKKETQDAFKIKIELKYLQIQK